MLPPNKPRYPIFTWQVDFDTAFNFDVTFTVSSTTYPATFPTGSYFGFYTTGSYGSGGAVAMTDNVSYKSLHAQLAQSIVDCLTDPAKFNSSTARITGSYRTGSGNYPEMIADFTRGGFTTPTTITFPSVEIAQMFGYSTTTSLNWPALTTLASTDINFDGYWYPDASDLIYQEWSTQDTYSSENLFGSTYNTLKWSNTKKNCIFDFQVFDAANIFEFRREDPAFSDQGVDSGDPNNVLEKMVNESIGKDIIVYYDHSRAARERIIDDSITKDINSMLEDKWSLRQFQILLPTRIAEENITLPGTVNTYT